jgi:hypothetical protein
MLCTFIFRLI